MSDDFNQNPGSDDGTVAPQPIDKEVGATPPDAAGPSDRPIRTTESLKSLIAKPKNTEQDIVPKIIPVEKKTSRSETSSDPVPETQAGADEATGAALNQSAVQEAPAATEEKDNGEESQPAESPGLFSWSLARSMLESLESEEVQDAAPEAKETQSDAITASDEEEQQSNADSASAEGMEGELPEPVLTNIEPQSIEQDAFGSLPPPPVIETTEQIENQLPSANEDLPSAEMTGGEFDASTIADEEFFEEDQVESSSPEFFEEAPPANPAPPQTQPQSLAPETPPSPPLPTVLSSNPTHLNSSQSIPQLPAQSTPQAGHWEEIGLQPPAPQPAPATPPLPVPATEHLTAKPAVKTGSPRRHGLIGQILFDAYAIMDLIGEGKSCSVYSAMQVNSANDAIVAVKTPNDLTPEKKQRFSQAVIKQGKLKHPHIVRSLSYLESPEGEPFYVMESTQGVSLEEILQSVGRLDDEEAIALILSQTASALEYAHSQGVTHDWLSPHNIILVDENEQLQVKVTDFQIATLEVSKQDKDWCYLSPEAARGESTTAQSDLYSLGVIAYRMITGHLPFGEGHRKSEDESPDELAKHGPELRQLHQLNLFIMEALESELSWRTDTAAAFKEAVQTWLEAVHFEFSQEAQLATGEIDLPNFSSGAYAQGNIAQELSESPAYPEHQPPYPQPSGTAAPPHLQQPGMVSPEAPPPAAPPSEPTPEEIARRRRARKRQSRTGAQNIRRTIHELVALKRKQSDQEQTVAMKFTEKIASETAGPRRSPLATMVRLIVFIVVLGGLSIGCITYIVTNPSQVREMYFQAARALSMLLPGKASPPDEIPVEEGAKIVVEPVKQDKKNTKPKLKPHEIRAVPQDWAVPRDSGQVSQNDSPSAGVTNNWSAPKRKGNRVRIEYRDFDNRNR